MFRFIGRVIRFDILFVASTVLFAILTAIGYYCVWGKVVGWMEPARVYSTISATFHYSTEPPRSLVDVVQQPMWMSFWTAIVSWWLILFAVIARKAGGGGGTIYQTATGYNSVVGTFFVRTPVGYVEPDKEEAKSHFYAALCFGVILMFFSVLPGLLISTVPGLANPYDPYRTSYATPSISSADQGTAMAVGLIVMFAIPVSFVAFPIAAKISDSGSSFMRRFRKMSYIAGWAFCLHAVAWVVIFVLCATDTLDTSNAGVVKYQESYISEMPTVDHVLVDMRTSDTYDTTARQSGALYQLNNMIEVMSEGRVFNNTLQPEEGKVYLAYKAAYARVQGAAEASFNDKEDAHLGMNSPRAKWFGLRTHYETDESFRDDLLKHYFSTDWQSRYLRELKAKG